MITISQKKVSKISNLIDCMLSFGEKTYTEEEAELLLLANKVLEILAYHGPDNITITKS